MTPRVSVLIPVHDPGAFLEPALTSVRNQTLRDFEVVCVDDGSTDGSPRILEAFARTDARFRLLRPGRIGLVAAANLLAREARAPYHACCVALLQCVSHGEQAAAHGLSHEPEYPRRPPEQAAARPSPQPSRRRQPAPRGPGVRPPPSSVTTPTRGRGPSQRSSRATGGLRGSSSANWPSS
ncbi:MAG: glycosyltransferase family 2 protein [Planctomycetota bacterium]